MSKWYSLAIAVLAIVILALSMACGDTSRGTNIAQLENQIQQAEAISTKAQVLGVLNLGDRSAFHAVDVDLQTASQINPQYQGTARKMRQAVAGTTWPTELQERAQILLVSLEEFQAALERADLAASKVSASKTHESYHDLSELAWPYVAGEAQPAGEHDE